MSIDYTIFYKYSLDPKSNWAETQKWDMFISAYNTNERVQNVYNSVQAEKKKWIVHSEYEFTPDKCPKEKNSFLPKHGLREDDCIQQFLAEYCTGIEDGSLCIDITGFMRPHLMFLLRVLEVKEIKNFDVLYSEPGQYLNSENTEFAQGTVRDVRPISGFEGLHQPSMGTEEDLLIIGAGYEHHLMRHVANANYCSSK
jgi:hypothetical protein